MADMRLPATLQTTHELRRRGGVVLLLRRDWAAALPAEAMLDGAPLSGWGRPVPHALRGRGPLHVLATERGEIVAKRLLRGGAAGALLRGWFADPRRPLREAAVAEALLARGCSTPPVVAVRTTRGALGLHRLELATARVASRGELLSVLREPDADWPRLARAAGRALRRLHDAGLHHRDLNARNLLVPAVGAHAGDGLIVLDLDRCRVGEPLTQRQRVAALARLARSLLKHRVLARQLVARDARACRAFFAGYGACGSRSRAHMLAATAARVGSTLWLHAWSWTASRRA